MIKKTFKEVNTGIHIEIIDNGYTMEVSGRDLEDDYKTCKLYYADIDDLAKQLEAARELYVSD